MMPKITTIDFTCHALHSSGKQCFYFVTFLDRNGKVDFEPR